MYLFFSTLLNGKIVGRSRICFRSSKSYSSCVKYMLSKESIAKYFFLYCTTLKNLYYIRFSYTSKGRRERNEKIHSPHDHVQEENRKNQPGPVEHQHDIIDLILDFRDYTANYVTGQFALSGLERKRMFHLDGYVEHIFHLAHITLQTCGKSYVTSLPIRVRDLCSSKTKLTIVDGPEYRLVYEVEKLADTIQKLYRVTYM